MCRMPSSDEGAIDCPHCGKRFWVEAGTSVNPSPWMFGFEYRSRQELFGLPLIHVATGINPYTGLPRLARGIIAIGNFAVGVVAVGGLAAGGLVLSGIGAGLMTLAGIAVGWIAVGGLAVGAAFALGGLAVSYGYAVGGLPLIINGIISTINPSDNP